MKVPDENKPEIKEPWKRTWASYKKFMRYTIEFAAALGLTGLVFDLLNHIH